VKITNWKAYAKGTMRGFCSLELDSGMVLHSCSLHEKEGGQRWVNLPQERVKQADGTSNYRRLVEFKSRQLSDKFNQQVLGEYDRMFGAHENHDDDAAF
jgi:DNA-binding cell septation regulator SpoVG